MRCDFLILGATGIQGRIVSRYLLEKNYKVIMCGRDKFRVKDLLARFNNTLFKYLDLRNSDDTFKTFSYFRPAVVINCAEGDWNINAMNAALKSKVSIIDLGSDVPMTKEQLDFHSKFKRAGILSITGCGSVPGIGNVMLRYAAEKFDEIETIEVGFAWDSNIKKFVVPFSIQSILEEMTDPAPVIENKIMRYYDPMKTIKKLCYRNVKDSICFFARHPETYTFFHYYKNKGVKNVRFYAGFPSHSFNVLRLFIDLGFNSKEEIFVHGNKIRPIDFLTEVLKKIKVPKGYKEMENLWVKVIGKKDSKRKEILMECLVNTIKGWEEAGSNIDTGFPAAIIAILIKNGIISEKGSFAPEAVVPIKPFFEELKKNHMYVLENGKRIN
ncbi:MAG: saccharopine dehydrogenase C-terminal domain-containing protein [Candidatus Pacearchaeota archaeon]